MTNKFELNAEEIKLFKKTILGTKPLVTNIISHIPTRRPKHKLIQSKSKSRTTYFYREKLDDNFYFSDEYQPILQNYRPISYMRSDINPYKLKKLSRGDYAPEIFLDLHGCSQKQAKQEISALINTCYQDSINCACIMHGHGKHILKQQIPRWLAQHPSISAFHQATKNWGGNAALFILIEINNKYYYK